MQNSSKVKGQKKKKLKKKNEKFENKKIGKSWQKSRKVE